MCLKLLFFHSKLVLQEILSLTVLSNCVSAVQILTPLFSRIVPNLVVFFFTLLDRKFNEDSKNVLKTVIFSLQVCFTGDCFPDGPFKLCFWQFKL